MAKVHLPIHPTDARAARSGSSRPPAQPRPSTTPASPGGPDWQQSSLKPDGSRLVPYPADVRGRFIRARRVVFALLVAWWAILPFLKVAGRPALQLDVESRRFFVFGATLNAQDGFLLFFLLTGIALSLAIFTALLGRVWCGWACPQTVFLEGLFRPIERWIEGPREVRLRRDQGPWTAGKIGRKALKQILFVVTAAFVAHVFVGYFVSPPKLWAMMRGSPSEHPEAFAWAIGMTAIFYGNFARFREQLCLAVCPYGRLQSILIDPDSLAVGYDQKRGEPRGKKGTVGAGDCVDCKRCVVVCPTGIDIRNGLQLDCIGCTQCIDACDEIMDKLGRPRGLVRYDSQRGLDREPRKILRPRLAIYLAVAAIWIVAATFAFRKRIDFEANLLRLRGAPFVVERDQVRNSFTIHLVNKRPDPASYLLTATAAEPAVSFVIAMPRAHVAPLGGIDVPIFATVPREAYRGPISFTVRVTEENGATREISGTLLGPTIEASR
jgi:cytochrome c oxidase accessory protein FixG